MKLNTHVFHFPWETLSRHVSIQFLVHIGGPEHTKTERQKNPTKWKQKTNKQKNQQPLPDCQLRRAKHRKEGMEKNTTQRELAFNKSRRKSYNSHCAEHQQKHERHRSSSALSQNLLQMFLNYLTFSSRLICVQTCDSEFSNHCKEHN